jgi:hypothetical protein
MEQWIGILVNLLLTLIGIVVMVTGAGNIILLVDVCGDSSYGTATRIYTTVGTKKLAIVYPKRRMKHTDF